LLVLELAEIHQLADRRARGGGNLHQVELSVARRFSCLLDGQDAELAPVLVDQSDFRYPDAVVDPELLVDATFLLRW
jgi:hypothetical protein